MNKEIKVECFQKRIYFISIGVILIWISLSGTGCKNDFSGGIGIGWGLEFSCNLSTYFR